MTGYGSGMVCPGWHKQTASDILDKSVANFKFSRRRNGSNVSVVTAINPFYGMDQFLVDLDTGGLFVSIKTQWRRSGLYCMNNPFKLEKLWKSIEHNCAIMKCDLEREDQTPVVRLQRTTQRGGVQLPSLPLMGDPKIYVLYPDAMPPLTRKNYVRDRTQSALTYILEYGQMEAMLKEGIYDENEVQQKLLAVFGRVNAIRKRIDEALEMMICIEEDEKCVYYHCQELPRTAVHGTKPSTYMDKVDKGKRVRE